MKRAMSVETELERALRIICQSAVVQRARISTRGGYSVTETATGEKMTGTGPALILVINEKLFKQGW